MRVGNPVTQNKTEYIEMYPETPRDISVLGNLPPEVKAVKPVNPKNPDIGQSPILVEAEWWERVECALRRRTA